MTGIIDHDNVNIAIKYDSEDHRVYVIVTDGDTEYKGTIKLKEVK